MGKGAVMNDELIAELEILKKDLISSGYTLNNPNCVEVIDDTINKLSEEL